MLSYHFLHDGAGFQQIRIFLERFTVAFIFCSRFSKPSQFVYYKCTDLASLSAVFQILLYRKMQAV